MILSNDGLVAFHYRSYGTFFLHKNRLHNIYRGFTHYKYYRAFFSIKSERVPFLQFHKIMIKWLNIKFGEKYEVQAYRI